MKGTVFYTQLNTHQASVVPSTKNFLSFPAHPDQLLQQPVVKTDCGSTISLFCFQDPQHMKEVCRCFPNEDFRHSIVEVVGVAGSRTLALRFEDIDRLIRYTVRLSLMTDIIPDGQAILVDKLHFHLCAEDIRCLLDTGFWTDVEGFQPHFDRFDLELLEKKKAADDLTAGSSSDFKAHPRRRWAVLGRDLLDQLGSIRCDDVELFVNKHTHDMSLWTWEEMRQFEKSVQHQQYLHRKELAALNHVPSSMEVFGELKPDASIIIVEGFELVG